MDFQKGPTRRVSVRIPFALGVTCRVSPGTSLAGHVKNLSNGGLMLALPQGIPPATRLTVAVPPWATLPPKEVQMELVWTRPGLIEEGVLHGLRFCADDITKELFLITTLLRRLLQQEEVSPHKKAGGTFQ